MIGRTLSHYKILEEISRGGMGIVYKALDLKLNREVALKVLPPDLVFDQERKFRFVQEAQAAAAIKHPNIAVVYDIGDEEGETFIVMELIEGDKLSDILKGGSLPFSRAVDIAMDIAAGLGSAHDKGIVHRDLKPANIMITREGHAKIIDFGLAKLVEPVSDPGSDAPTAAKGVTHSGQVLGTFNYMSPEQARGQKIDHRSDIFSFGVVLYEMLAGETPFRRSTSADTLSAILRDPAPPLSVSGCSAEQKQELQRLLDGCLAKDPEDRLLKAETLGRELSTTISDRTLARQPILWARLKQPRFAIPLLLVLAVLFGFVGLTVQRSARARQARLETIPEIMRLVEQNDYTTAYALAERVEGYLPDDPILGDLWPRFAVHTTIHSEPSDVLVSVKEYSAPQTDWRPLGRTPIDSVRLPRGVLQWRFEKDGFEAAERSSGAFIGTIKISMSEGVLPADMVRVPEADIGFFLLTGFSLSNEVNVPEFLVGRYEVTNLEFREFVESGGYREPEHWGRVKFVKGGMEIDWEEAMAEFRDRTGRPGPSTWQGGKFPEGEENHPVRGVSWYEAEAYAAFRGKSLPTIYHWSRAIVWPFVGEVELQQGEVIGIGAFRSELISSSNFSGASAAAVGTYHGAGPYGTYDTAGNIREWCWNATEDTPGSDRYVLGGAWSDPSYLYTYGVAQSPWDRSETNGFRLVQHSDEGDVVATLRRPVEFPGREEIAPISDEVFQVYRDLYAYDRTELNVVAESSDDSAEHWQRETVSFDATYGSDRVIAHLFLPKNVDPPYQIVAYYPSSGAIYRRSSGALQMSWIDFIIMSGRAVAYPVLMGTYERNIGLDTTWPKNTRTYSDHVVKWIQDFRRTIDYLETRDDIDLDRLGFHGFSWGGWNGPIVLALDDRFKTGVFVSGGIPPTLARPEASSASFASRVKAPVLMITGRQDILRPLETFQRPMFESLGTAVELKRHAILDGGHSPPRNQVIREILEWFDQYLGPVE